MTFTGDVRTAVAVCARRPLLPLLVLPPYLVLGGALLADAAVGFGRFDRFDPLTTVAAVAWLVFRVGYARAQRVWFTRDLTLAEVGRLMLDRFLPFVLLGLFGFLVLGGLGHLLTLPVRLLPLPRAVETAVALVPAGVVLTYVAPALALRTPDIAVALRQGWWLLRAYWPATAPYALVPAVAGAALEAYRTISTPGVALLVFAAGDLLLTPLRGATVLHYERLAELTEPTTEPEVSVSA